MSFLTPAISMGTRYKLVRRKSRTGKLVQETGWINNLITNYGMNAIPTVSNQPNAISVGTSNASPSVTDTHLINRVATAQLSTGEFSIDVPNRQAVARHSATFPSGSAAGNLAEIGLTASSSPYNAITRALITDEFGSPTVITVLPDEDLVVFMEFRIDQPTEDFTGTVDGLDYLVRAAYADNVYVASGTGAQRGWRVNEWNSVWELQPYNSTGVGTYSSARTSPSGVGDITSGPSDLRSHVSYQRETLSYTTDSHTRVYRLRFLAGILTGQPIRSITYNIGPTCWQMEFGQDLVKGELEALRLDFRLSWARP